MVESTDGVTAGLRLPPDVVQPFLLRFRRDDWHVMAFFSGHPQYEAVEAMIRNQGNGRYSVRAILTRHDQTQIDHVNDETLLLEARNVHRQTCHREIQLRFGASGEKRQARIEFVSHADEQIVLDLTTVGPPSLDRAGLTDPGGHSPRSSLPLMWRGASTLAGPQTEVVIDGKKYDVPVRLRAASFVAHEGYYAERHALAVIRAGTTRLRLRSRPVRIEVGAEWIFESDGHETAYRIASCGAGGQLQITKLGGSSEIITGAMVGQQLEITQIRCTAAESPQDGFILAFDANDCFRLSVDRARDLVTGDVAVVQEADRCVIRLNPVQPDWAKARSVTVTCSRSDNQLISATTIGVTSDAG
jgi:hypothetical protein